MPPARSTLPTRQRPLPWCLRGALAAALACAPTLVAAESLWDALQRLAEQHDATLLSRAGPALQQTEATAGALPEGLDAALNALLHNSPFRWRRLPSGMLLIERRRSARLQLDTLHIEDSAAAVPAATEAHALPRPTLRPEEHVGAERLPLVALASSPLQRSDVLWRRAPNVLAAGDALTVRGVERGAVATATSQAYLDGIPLPAVLLRNTPLPLGLQAVSFLRGPRTLADSLGGLGGAVQLRSVTPVPRAGRSLLLRAGGDSQQLGFSQQAGDLPWGSSGRIGVAAVHADARQRGADGRRPVDTDLGVFDARWRWEPDWQPALTLDLAAFLQRGALSPERLVPALGGGADPRSRRSAGPLTTGRQLDAEGAGIDLRSPAPWIGQWQLLASASQARLDTTRRFADDTGEVNRLDEREQLQALELRWQATLPRELDAEVAFSHGERRGELRERLESPLASFFPPGVLLGIEGASQRVFATRSDDLGRTRGLQIRLGRQHAGYWWSAALQRQRESRAQRQGREIGLDNDDCTLRFVDQSVPCVDEFPSFSSRLAVASEEWQTVPQLAAGLRSESGIELGLLLRRGLLPGGARLNPADQNAVRYEAERSDTAEVSARWRGERLDAMLSLFHNRWRDRQVRLDLPVSESFLIVNAGEAQARGGEASLAGGWEDARGAWQWRAALGFLDSEFLRVGDGTSLLDSSAVGRAFPSAPRWTAALGLDWERGPWRVQLAGWASAAAFSDAANSNAGERPGHAVFDAALHYRVSPRLSLQLLVENLADRAYVEDIRVAGAAPQVRDYLPGRRREIALGLRVDWP